MDPKCQAGYFDAIYRGLEGRAYGHYEHLTVDNLTFLEENTCDDAVAAFKGNDAARRIWNGKYGPLVKQLEWCCYKLSDYPNFHARFAEKNPALPCTISLFTFEDGEMSQTHPSDCYLSGDNWRGCDICNLFYALDNSRSEKESVERELKRHVEFSKENGKTEQRVVMFNGVGLSMQCSWDASDGRPSTLEVTGRLGVVLQGTDWDNVLNVDADARSEIEKKEPPRSKSGWLREYLQQGAIESEARQKEAEEEMIRKKREEETPPPDAHVICCHGDVPRDGFIHREKDGQCWETRDPNGNPSWSRWDKVPVARKDITMISSVTYV